MATFLLSCQAYKDAPQEYMKSLKVLQQEIQIHCGIMTPYSDVGEYPSLLEC